MTLFAGAEHRITRIDSIISKLLGNRTSFYFSSIVMNFLEDILPVPTHNLHHCNQLEGMHVKTFALHHENYTWSKHINKWTIDD